MQISTWPDELSALAKALYESGKYKTKQIAAMIGHGKSKNAVVGKAHREGWHNPDPAKGGTKIGDKRPRQPRLWRGYVSAPVIEQPAELPLPADFLGLPLESLAPNQCRYPSGDGPYLFCGQPTEIDASYCRHHNALCHDPHKLRGVFVGSQKF